MTSCILRRRTILRVSLAALVFSLSGLLKHLLRMVVHLLFFRSSTVGSTTSVFLDHVSRDWGDVTVVVVELSWTKRRLLISSTAAIDYSHFLVGIAVRTLLSGRIFAKFEDLGVAHVGDQVLRFFAELVDLLRLSQVLNERFFILVVLELFDQPLDFVLAYCILLLDWTSLHISCHTFELQPIIDSWASHRLGAHCHRVLHVWLVHRPIVQSGHCASVQTCLMCIQRFTHRCFLTLALQRPHRLPWAVSYALTVNVLRQLSHSVSCLDCARSHRPARWLSCSAWPAICRDHWTPPSWWASTRSACSWCSSSIPTGAWVRLTRSHLHGQQPWSLFLVRRMSKGTKPRARTGVPALCGCVASAVQRHSKPPILKRSFAPRLKQQLNKFTFIAWSVTIRSADVCLSHHDLWTVLVFLLSEQRSAVPLSCCHHRYADGLSARLRRSLRDP